MFFFFICFYQRKIHTPAKSPVIIEQFAQQLIILEGGWTAVDEMADPVTEAAIFDYQQITKY